MLMPKLPRGKLAGCLGTLIPALLRSACTPEMFTVSKILDALGAPLMNGRTQYFDPIPQLPFDSVLSTAAGSSSIAFTVLV